MMLQAKKMNSGHENLQRIYFDGANCRLSAVVAGDVENPAMVLVHGTHDHALSFLQLIDYFSASHYVISVDLRGHGSSDKPGIYTLVDMVADLEALIEHCDLNEISIVSHSLGGYIACLYSVLHPDVVSSLVLLDALGPPLLGKGDVRTRKLIYQLGVAQSRQPLVKRSIQSKAEALSRFTAANANVDAVIAQKIVEEGIEPSEKGVWQWRWDPAIRNVFFSFSMEELETLYPLIQCPVLYVTGEFAFDYWCNVVSGLSGRSDLFADDITRRSQLFRDFTHREIATAGHMLHYDQAEAVIDCIKSHI